jgi:hypothetical protein
MISNSCQVCSRALLVVFTLIIGVLSAFVVEAQDCNNNSVSDVCEINPYSDAVLCPNPSGYQRVNDCNANGVPDECDLVDGTSLDCNNNNLPDECDVANPVVAITDNKADSGKCGAADAACTGPGMCGSQFVYLYPYKIGIGREIVGPLGTMGEDGKAKGLTIDPVNGYIVTVDCPGGVGDNLEQRLYSVDPTTGATDDFPAVITSKDTNLIYGLTYDSTGEIFGAGPDRFASFDSSGFLVEETNPAGKVVGMLTTPEGYVVSLADSDWKGDPAYPSKGCVSGRFRVHCAGAGDPVEECTAQGQILKDIPIFDVEGGEENYCRRVIDIAYDLDDELIGVTALYSWTSATAPNIFFDFVKIEMPILKLGGEAEQTAAADEDPIGEILESWPLGSFVAGLGENGVPNSRDCDKNQVPDECQPDQDGDGIHDVCDECPADPAKTKAGNCGCGVPEGDLNENGIPDCKEVECKQVDAAGSLADMVKVTKKQFRTFKKALALYKSEISKKQKKKLLKQASRFNKGNRDLVGLFPDSYLSCPETESLCVHTNGEAEIAVYGKNAKKLHRLTLKLTKRLKKEDRTDQFKKKSNKTKKLSLRQKKLALKKLAEFPAIVSECTWIAVEN